MGYAVLHYQKESNAGTGLSKHIDRGWWEDGEWKVFIPNNADKERTKDNRELIDMRDESGRTMSRDERIAKRIKETGVSVKKNSVIAISIIMSASCEDMQRIKDEERFDQWCESCLSWVRQTHGEENVVAAALHMDEKTPHIHVTVVPIVQGLSKDQIYRAKKESKELEKAKLEGREVKKKRKYKKKDENELRLCAADVMDRTKLKEYQTSYSDAVKPYGLERGVDGSIARHIDINDWYKTLFREAEKDARRKLKEEMEAMDKDFEEKKKAKQKEQSEELKAMDLKFEKEKKAKQKDIDKLNKEIGKLKEQLQTNTQLVQQIETLKKIVGNPMPTPPPNESTEEVWKDYYDSIPIPQPELMGHDRITIMRSNTSNAMEISADVLGRRVTKTMSWYLSRDYRDKIIDKIKVAACVFYEDIRSTIARSNLGQMLGLTVDQRQNSKSQGISI